MPALAPVITTVCVMSPSLPALGSSVSPLVPGGREAGGAFEEKRVHEGLREVAPQLALGHVVFLGEQAGRAARSPVALEPADRLDLLALLVQGEGQDETAQYERSFGLAERPRVVPEPVGVAVLDEFGQVGAQRLDGPR